MILVVVEKASFENDCSGLPLLGLTRRLGQLVYENASLKMTAPVYLCWA